jgi:hypothetical protein
MWSELKPSRHDSDIWSVGIPSTSRPYEVLPSGEIRYTRAHDVHVADVNGEGLLDVVAAAYDADKVVWLLNDGEITVPRYWPVHEVQAAFDVAIYVGSGDLDGDGDQDLAVVEWNADRISVYSNQGGQYRVECSDHAPAYLANGSSAAVVRFSVTSMGWSFDPDSELRRVSLNLVDGIGQPFTETQATAIFAAVQVWHDANASGYFESWEDLLLRDGPPPMPAPGHLYVELPAGGGSPSIAGAGGSETYFVVFETTADATAHLPDESQVRRLPGASQMTSYVDFPTIRLQGEWWEAVVTRTVTLGEDPSLLFADDFEAGTTGAWSSTVP